jgi:hypothetical protein
MSSSQLTKRDKYCYDFIRGMELCKNALEYFNNTYINDLTNKYAKDYTIRECINGCNEVIAVYLMLEAEYKYLYSNVVLNNKETELFTVNTKYVFREKSNPYYGTFAFVKSKNNDFYSFIKEHNKRNPNDKYLDIRLEELHHSIQDQYIKSELFFQFFLKTQCVNAQKLILK